MLVSWWDKPARSKMFSAKGSICTEVGRPKQISRGEHQLSASQVRLGMKGGWRGSIEVGGHLLRLTHFSARFLFLCCLHSHFAEVFLLKVYLSLWIVKCFIYLLSTVRGIKPRPSSLLAKLCTIEWHLNPSSLIYRVWVLVLRKGFFFFFFNLVVNNW